MASPERSTQPVTAAPAFAASQWALLLTAAGLYSMAFALIEVGLTTAPASVIVMGRLWIGAALVWLWMHHRGHRLPPLVSQRPDPAWLWLLALGVIGATLPFTLISLGQRHVDSAVAGILMAAMPLTTIALAHVFVPGDGLTWRKAAGFFVGFVGVTILIGPSALAELGGSQSVAQLLILIATVSYAATTIVARRAPALPPSVSSTGMLLAAAITATPFGVAALANDTGGVSAVSALAIIALGMGSTGVATIVLMQLIRTAGPSFVALMNYIIPVTATFIGVALGEALGAHIFAALAVILAGVAIATRKPRIPAER